MIIRLDVNGLDALPIMDTLKRNGYYPVLTFKETDSKDSTYVYPYCISFDTEGQLVKGGDVCIGDCLACSLCDETCEEWEDCEHGAVMHNSEPKDEEEDNKILENIYFADFKELFSDLVDSAKAKSRILNEQNRYKK